MLLKLSQFFLGALWTLSIGLSAHPLPPLPEPVSNNAVTAVENNGRIHLFSFMGLGPGKTWESVHNKAWKLSLGDTKWQALPPVPSSLPLIGRLASVAVSAKKQVFLFGGYTVASDHAEISSPDNFRFDPGSNTYTPIAPMPVPVDDAVALVYNDAYIYLISGWHNDGNVNLVQMYDIDRDKWTQASPLPGHGVFGHAGGIVDGKIVVCDGVKVMAHPDKRRTFVAEPACYFGSINADRPVNIDWRTLPHPSGKARYRMAAAGVAKTNTVVFFGGTDNPYNYNGIGYDGRPSSPSPDVWQFDLTEQKWIIGRHEPATMDHRGLLVVDGKLMVIGGMGQQQAVLDSVNVISIIAP